MPEPKTEITIGRVVEIVDGVGAPPDEKEYAEAYQYLVDTGLAWQWQGRVGRQATHLIEIGVVQPVRH